MTQRINIAQVAPAAYQAVLGLERYIRENVDPTVLELVKLRGSILNGCSFCVDMHTREAMAAGESSRRLFAVAAWREAPFFSERERAALALTDAVTRLGEHGVPDEVWDVPPRSGRSGNSPTSSWRLRQNVWNRIAVTSRTAPPETV